MNCPRYVNPDGILENFLSPTVMTSASVLAGRPAELGARRPGRPHPREPERRVWRASGRVGRLRRDDLLAVDRRPIALAEDALADDVEPPQPVPFHSSSSPPEGAAGAMARPANRVSSIAPEQSHRPQAVSTSRTASRAAICSAPLEYSAP